MAGLNAFRFSGRFIVMMTTASSRSTVQCSVEIDRVSGIARLRNVLDRKRGVGILRSECARPQNTAGRRASPWYRRVVEFRRINELPPYVFATIDALKMEARRAGEDVIDLGFGNPDLPSPPVAVDKMCEAVRNPRNHRYSASKGIPKLRLAIADLYERKFGVSLDPETQVCTTIGAKEGFSHLMWVLLGPGDAALVPSPSYPIHLFAPLFAEASAREIPMSTDGDFIERVREAYEYSWPRPRVIVLSFPHNPTTATVELDFFQEVVDFAREREVIVVHDNAYAELDFDGFEPPSILQAEGAKECAVELYSMTKSFSMAGWRVALLAG